MNKKITIIAILAIIIMAVGVVFLFWPHSTSAPINNNINPPVVKNDIEIFLPAENAVIGSPLKITGQVNGNGWSGFEGQVGTVRLLDSNNNELALGILTATSDWMVLPTPFETTLNFVSPGPGSGSLVFKNENPSGDPVRDKTVTLPITFQ